MGNVTTIDIDGGASPRQIGTACAWVKAQFITIDPRTRAWRSHFCYG
jgi:hypothetical protein